MESMPKMNTLFWVSPIDDKGRIADDNVIGAAERQMGNAEKMAAKYLRDPSRAAEIMEETVFRVSEVLRKCRNGSISNLEAYLIQSYENRVREIQKREGRCDHLGTLHDLALSVETALNVQASVFHSGLETSTMINDVLSHLNDRSRRLLAMKFYGYSYDAIGRHFGITSESARVQVSRLLAKLRLIANQPKFQKVGNDA
jgi:RNA polymerase sigma factor (sigma-70 family)